MDSECVEIDSIPRGSERILFIDDEKFLADIGKNMLSWLGYRVKSITSPDDALAEFRANPDEYDLIVTDITMPGMTGDNLAEKIREIRPDMLVVLCTGFSRKIMQGTKIDGIKKVLMKPITLNKLARGVRDVLDMA